MNEYQEWAELWEAVYGEPPPIAAEIALTARVLIQCLPPAEPYEVGRRQGLDKTSSSRTPGRSEQD